MPLPFTEDLVVLLLRRSLSRHPHRRPGEMECAELARMLRSLPAGDAARLRAQAQRARDDIKRVPAPEREKHYAREAEILESLRHASVVEEAEAKVEAKWRSAMKKVAADGAAPPPEDEAIARLLGEAASALGAKGKKEKRREKHGGDEVAAEHSKDTTVASPKTITSTAVDEMEKLRAQLAAAEARLVAMEDALRRLDGRPVMTGWLSLARPCRDAAAEGALNDTNNTSVEHDDAAGGPVRWTTHWFVLRVTGSLDYYRQQAPEQSGAWDGAGDGLIGSVPLDGARIDTHDASRELRISAPDGDIVSLRASTDLTRKSWCDAIDNVIQCAGPVRVAIGRGQDASGNPVPSLVTASASSKSQSQSELRPGPPPTPAARRRRRRRREQRNKGFTDLDDAVSVSRAVVANLLSDRGLSAHTRCVLAAIDNHRAKSRRSGSELLPAEAFAYIERVDLERAGVTIGRDQDAILAAAHRLQRGKRNAGEGDTGKDASCCDNTDTDDAGETTTDTADNTDRTGIMKHEQVQVQGKKRPKKKRDNDNNNNNNKGGRDFLRDPHDGENAPPPTAGNGVRDPGVASDKQIVTAGGDVVDRAQRMAALDRDLAAGKSQTREDPSRQSARVSIRRPGELTGDVVRMAALAAGMRVRITPSEDTIASAPSQSSDRCQKTNIVGDAGDAEEDIEDAPGRDGDIDIDVEVTGDRPPAGEIPPCPDGPIHVVCCVPEFPAEGGIRFVILARKHAALTLGQSRVRIEGDDFWKALETVAGKAAVRSARLALHPFTLTPSHLDPYDFESGETKVSTLLSFGTGDAGGVRVKRKVILRKLAAVRDKANDPTFTLVVERGTKGRLGRFKVQGTLFRIETRASELLRGHEP